MKNTRFENIIEGLKRCASNGFEECEQCPYSYKNNGTKPFPQCATLLLIDTITLLMEQKRQLALMRLILNANYDKEVMEELKWNTLLTFILKIRY